MKADLGRLQKVLDMTKQGVETLDKDLQLLQIELNYKKFISTFSPAYLSGSDWYVGPSFIEYLKTQNIPLKTLLPLLIVANSAIKK